VNRILKQVVEQFLHFAVGYLVVIAAHTVAPVAPLWLFLFSSCIVVVREFIVQWPIERPWDTALDMFFWLLGSIVAVHSIETLGW